jgi:nucleoside-diphosphate-sugar epimerase
MVSGLIAAMEQEHTRGEVINIGNPNEYTVLDIARLIVKLTQSSSTIEFLSLPADDPTRRKPDIAKAQKLLGWNPTVPIEDGLLQMIEEFKLEGHKV